MADYVAIQPTQTDPLAPLTSSLGKQLEENPRAMFEGAVNAPGLQLRGFQKLAVGNVPKTALMVHNAGTTINFRFGFIQVGTVRLNYSSAAPGSGGTSVNISRTRAGVTTVLVTSGAGNSGTIDVPVISGDLMTFVRTGFTANEFFSAQLLTDGSDYFPVAVDPYAEGNNV